MYNVLFPACNAKMGGGDGSGSIVSLIGTLAGSSSGGDAGGGGMKTEGVSSCSGLECACWGRKCSESQFSTSASLSSRTRTVRRAAAAATFRRCSGQCCPSSARSAASSVKSRK